MPQTKVTVGVNCLACEREGNGKMFQCAACTKPIHSHCLIGKNETETESENVLTNLFISIESLHYICPNCIQQVNSFYVKMSQEKVTIDVEVEEKGIESAELALVNENKPNEVEDKRTNDTGTDKKENIENRKTPNAYYNDRPICKYFNTGSCDFNNKCKYRHPDIRKLCRDYMNGRCSFKNCKYAHPDLCWASQQNRCFKKGCNYFHAPPPTEYARKETTYQKRYFENKKYHPEQNENKSHFLENMMRNFQQQLEHMQKMLISQNQRGQTYPQAFPQFPPTIPFPPHPQPPPGRHF